MPQDLHLQRSPSWPGWTSVGDGTLILVPEEGFGFKSRTHDHRFCLSFIYETFPASRSCQSCCGDRVRLSTSLFRDLLWEGQGHSRGCCELVVGWVLTGTHGLEEAEELSQENRSSEELD